MNANDYWTRPPALITARCTISPARPQAAWAARLDDLAGPPARLSDGEAESDAVRLPGWSGLRSPDPGFGVRTLTACQPVTVGMMMCVAVPSGCHRL